MEASLRGVKESDFPIKQWIHTRRALASLERRGGRQVGNGLTVRPLYLRLYLTSIRQAVVIEDLGT